MTRKKAAAASWVIAAPLIPFFVAARMGGRARRGERACWTPRDCGTKSRTPDETQRAERSNRPTRDVVDTVSGAGSFSTLVKALEAAELTGTLKENGPFTVFAPTDDAFGRLPEGALDELLADREKLTAVLLLHVVPGRVPASALPTYAAVKTARGEALPVDTSMGVKVGSAYVIQPDLEASNGIVHAIDSVLLPG